MEEQTILVSACLLGVASRYDRSSKKDQRVIEFLRGKRFVPVCPESLSGLPVPRQPAMFDRGDGADVLSGKSRVLLRTGEDVTEEFLRGAQECLKIARLAGASAAVLKERSPSCGVRRVYVDGKLLPGTGLFTAFLMEEGVKVYSEEELGNMECLGGKMNKPR